MIQNLSYTYNAVGNVTGVTDNADSTRTQTFTYDDLQRLLTAAGAYGTTSYAYDAVGNRTQKISDAGGRHGDDRDLTPTPPPATG